MKIQAVLNAKAGQLYFILTCQFTGDFANVGVAAYLCTGKNGAGLQCKGRLMIYCGGASRIMI